jgi:hypothetical protein
LRHELPGLARTFVFFDHNNEGVAGGFVDVAGAEVNLFSIRDDKVSGYFVLVDKQLSVDHELIPVEPIDQ